MHKTIKSVPVSSDLLEKVPTKALDHLPGPKGHWLSGNIHQLTPNPLPFLRLMGDQFGDCFTVGFLFNRRALMMVGPEANELLLLDPENNFSSRWGWEVVHPFFGRNILVRDFEDHRLHRKLMTHIFKPQALEIYLDQMYPVISEAIDRYDGHIDVYQRTKKMALDMAIRVFTGITSEAQLDAWNHDLSLVLSNVMAARVRLPGTKYWQALKARDRLRQRLAVELKNRRGSYGEDLFSKLANLRDDNDRMLSEQDVIDHMFGILFAAHDTTASSLSMIFWLLAEHPGWQTMVRDECVKIFEKTGSKNLPYEYLSELPVIEAIFKETLRMYAPIQLIPRRSVAGFSFQGHEIPANTWLLLSPQVTHFNPRLYNEPECFDPARFLDPSNTQTPFSFVPFGKGSHMCMGMHFAYMEIKAVLYRLLLSSTLEQDSDQHLNLQYLPIVRPLEEMKVRFVPHSAE